MRFLTTLAVFLGLASGAAGADETDPVRGPHVDNAELGQVLMDLAHRAAGMHAEARAGTR